MKDRIQKERERRRRQEGRKWKGKEGKNTFWQISPPCFSHRHHGLFKPWEITQVNTTCSPNGLLQTALSGDQAVLRITPHNFVILWVCSLSNSHHLHRTHSVPERKPAFAAVGLLEKALSWAGALRFGLAHPSMGPCVWAHSLWDHLSLLPTKQFGDTKLSPKGDFPTTG